MSSPTQRTLKLLTAEGWEGDIVERWVGQAGAVCPVCRHKIPWRGARRDLFGFGDLLFLRPGEARIVQACNASGIAERHAKMLASDLAPLWMSVASTSLEIIGWYKGPQVRGGKRQIWKPRRRMVLTGDTEAG